MQVTTGLEGDGIRRFADAVRILGNEDEARAAYSRALNKVGAKAHTRTVRALTKQVGLSKGDVLSYGAVRKERASRGKLDYQIVSTGKPIPLRAFAPKQFRFGVRAKVWGRMQRFPGAFIYAGKGWTGRFGVVHGGHVLHRTGRRVDGHQPYELMFGPTIPVEMVKDASAKAFQEVAQELPARVAHEVSWITKGVVSA